MERDKQGWRIPQPGTVSRQIYDLLIAGKPMSEIFKLVDADRRTISVLKWKFTHPDEANERGRQ